MTYSLRTILTVLALVGDMFLQSYVSAATIDSSSELGGKSNVVVAGTASLAQGQALPGEPQQGKAPQGQPPAGQTPMMMDSDGKMIPAPQTSNLAIADTFSATKIISGKNVKLNNQTLVSTDSDANVVLVGKDSSLSAKKTDFKEKW